MTGKKALETKNKSRLMFDSVLGVPEQSRLSANAVRNRLIDIITWVWLGSSFDSKKATDLVERLDDIVFEIEDEYDLIKNNGGGNHK